MELCNIMSAKEHARTYAHTVLRVAQSAGGSASLDKFHKSHGGVTDHWARTSRRMKAIFIVHSELLDAATVLPRQDEEDEET